VQHGLMLASDGRMLCSHVVEAARMKIVVINLDQENGVHATTLLKQNEVVQIEELIPEVASKYIDFMRRSIY
jgi:hypothetical protein